MNPRPKYLGPLVFMIVSIFVTVLAIVWAWLDAKMHWSEGANIGAGLVGYIGLIMLVASLVQLRESITNKFIKTLLLTLTIGFGLLMALPFLVSGLYSLSVFF